jgi:cell division protein FtsL
MLYHQNGTQMNKQLTQQQNLDELMKQTLLNILSAKGIIYTYYKNKQLTQGNYDYQMERTSK